MKDGALQRPLRHHHSGATHKPPPAADRKSTRLNSSHLVISYAVFCLKKKKEASVISFEPSVAPHFVRFKAAAVPSEPYVTDVLEKSFPRCAWARLKQTLEPLTGMRR